MTADITCISLQFLTLNLEEFLNTMSTETIRIIIVCQMSKFSQPLFLFILLLNETSILLGSVFPSQSEILPTFCMLRFNYRLLQC